MEPSVHPPAYERMLIFQGQQEGPAQAAIARRLGRNRATVSRELRRNPIPAGCRPDVAQRCYQARRRRCRRRPRLLDRRLQRNVLQLLEPDLSPEQISGRLRIEQGRTAINHETIYRFVYKSPPGRQEELYQYLRRGKKKRTRRQGRRSHVSPIAQRLCIDARPLAATQRTEICHWESDSLLFGHDQALNVLVERLSRFPASPACAARRLRTPARCSWPAAPGRLPHASVTADNGSENAGHMVVSQALSIPFDFCHPDHSWEKGTVENTNGLLRRCVPRDTDPNRVPRADLDAIAAELNLRPGTCFGFRTPREVPFGVSVALSYRIHRGGPQRNRGAVGDPAGHRKGEGFPPGYVPGGRSVIQRLEGAGLQASERRRAEAVPAGVRGGYEPGARFGAHADQLLTLRRGERSQVGDDHAHALLSQSLQQHAPAWACRQVIDNHAQLGVIKGPNQLLELAAEVILRVQPSEGRPGAVLLQRVLAHHVHDDRAEGIGMGHELVASQRVGYRIA